MLANRLFKLFHRELGLIHRIYECVTTVLENKKEYHHTLPKHNLQRSLAPEMDKSSTIFN